jgi:endonuclease YncB( thermonuclease family)
VVWITDGDTIDVVTAEGEITVRMDSINAPDREECYYDEALDHLIDTLKDAMVLLEVTGEDQFERTLAHVFEGDRHVNLEMVFDGMALATTPEEGDRHSREIIEAEKEAFESGTGLWDPNACSEGGATREVSFEPGTSLTDPPGPDEDRLDAEVVAIVNRGGDSVDLSDWMVRDESSRHRFTFAPGSTLEPGQRLAIPSDASGWDPGGESVWSNGGDMALLLDPDGNVVDRWRY